MREGLSIRDAESIAIRPDRRYFGTALAGAAGLIALSVLVFGWGLGIDAFRRISPDYPAMVPATAADILLGSIGALALYRRPARWITLAAAAAIIVLVIVNINNPLLPVEYRNRDGMSVASMLAAILLAISLCLRSFGFYGVAIVGTTLASALISVCVIGYMFDAQDLFDNPVYTKMALHTAVAYLALHSSLLLSQPDKGWVGVLLGPETGSQMARRVLPVIIAATLVFCMLTKSAVENQIMTVGFRLALLTYLIIASASVAVIGFAYLANIAERRSVAAEAAYMKSERRQKEMELAAARAQKIEALGLLVAGVAHDFNNTLSVILGNLELMEANPDPEQRKAYLAESMAASNRAAHLTQQLLAYGRKSRLSPRLVRIDDALDPALTMFRRVCPANIELSRDLAFGDAMVRLDPVAFQQAVLNILINARDAIEAGGTITVIGRTGPMTAQDVAGIGGMETLAPGTYATITVRDTGVGMDPDTAHRATEPFFSTKKFGSGTGLGLSTVSGFCRQSGGGMRIESSPGHGTDVILAFPVVDRPQDEAPQTVVEAGPPVARRGILVVDDDEAVHRVIANQLELDGHNVRVAGDAEEALALLQEGAPPELVIADIIMPGAMQGYDLAVRIQQRYPGLPVLLMSGYDSAANREKLATIGDVPFLQKPINLRTLRTVVGQALENPDQDPVV